ncbi:hypothetical protein FDECE_9561 [Fusarium decemcellulare]|nr:hypothetical protein FDECE_9561 [Fusarium decemcellulare]
MDLFHGKPPERPPHRSALRPGDHLPPTLEHVILMIQSPLDDSPAALPAGTMMTLGRARARGKGDTDTEPLEPSHYTWSLFVKLVAPAAHIGRRRTPFACKARLPPCPGEASDIAMRLDCDATLQTWLGCIVDSILDDTFDFSVPLRLHPQGDQMAPRLHPRQHSLEHFDDVQTGLLSELYRRRHATTPSSVAEFFQIQADDSGMLPNKVLPGTDTARPLYPYQLDGIYRLIHGFAELEKCSGQYLADEEGLDTKLSLLALVAVCHLAQHINQHIRDHPERHHPELDTSQHPDGTCPESAGFGIQCLCVRGSILAKFMAKRSRMGCTVIVCNSDLVESYKALINSYLQTTISNGSLEGKHATHAYLYREDGKLEPITGCDKKEPDKRDFSHFRPFIDINAKYRGNSVRIDLSGSATTRGTKRPIEDAFGDGGDESTGHFLRYRSHKESGPDESGKTVSQPTSPSKALGNTLLILSRDLLEYGKESHLTTTRSLNVIGSDWTSDDTPPQSASFYIRTSLYSTSLFCDLGRRPFERNRPDVHWVRGQRTRCRDEGGARWPFIVLASPAPFPADADDLEPTLRLLCEDANDATRMRNAFRDLASASKPCYQWHHGCKSIVPSREFKEAMESAVCQVEPFVVARNQLSQVTPSTRVVDGGQAGEVFNQRHQTPPQYRPSLKNLTSRVADAIRQLTEAGGGVTPSANQVLSLDVFQHLHWTSSVPALLAGDADASGRPLPSSYPQLEADLPPSARGGQPGVDPPAGPDGQPWPRRILSIAQREDLLDDQCLADTIKILAEAAGGLFWHPDREPFGQRPGKPSPRHVVISCPLPITALYAYYALKRISGESIEAYLLTREWPPPAQRRAVVMSWEERARELENQVTQSQQYDPKVLVTIISTEVLESIGVPFSFATIMIIWAMAPRAIQPYQNILQTPQTIKDLYTLKTHLIPQECRTTAGTKRLHGQISIQWADIAMLEVEAVVNAAQPNLQQGGGICGAIFAAAGAKDLKKACDAFGRGIDAGQAVLTDGCGLVAKHIIHAVGPNKSVRDEQKEAPELLSSVYREIFELCKAHKIKKIAIPSISSGIYGIDPDLCAFKAAEAAVFALFDPDLRHLEVVFVIFCPNMSGPLIKYTSHTGEQKNVTPNEMSTILASPFLDALHLSNVQLIVRSRFSTSNMALVPGTILGLWRVHPAAHGDQPSDPQSYKWEAFVRLLAWPPELQESEDFRLQVDVPSEAEGSPMTTRILFDESNFHAWLGGIMWAIQCGTYCPGRDEPLGLRPAVDASPVRSIPHSPARVEHQRTENDPGHDTRVDQAPDKEIEVVDLTAVPDSDSELGVGLDIADASEGLLAHLYSIPTIESQEELDEVVRLFQLLSDDYASLSDKTIPGLNQSLNAWQLLAVYKIIKKIVSSSGDESLRGQYLADMPGLGKTFTIVVLMVLQRYVRLIRQHIEDHPGDHNAPDSRGDTCQYSKQFGFECLCVKGSLLRQWESRLPDDGFTVVLASPKIIGRWRYEFDDQVSLTIDKSDHPFHGSPFLRAYEQSSGSNLRPLPGQGKQNHVRVAPKNFLPKLSYVPPTGGGPLLVDMPATNLKSQGTMKAAKCFELSRTGYRGPENARLYFSWDGQPAARSLVEPNTNGKVKADSSIILLLSSSLVESKRLKHYGLSLTIDVLSLKGRQRKPNKVTLMVEHAMRTSMIIFDEVHERKPIRNNISSFMDHMIRLNSGRCGRLKFSPLVILASGTPFTAKTSDIAGWLGMLSWYKDPKVIIEPKFSQLDDAIRKATIDFGDGEQEVRVDQDVMDCIDVCRTLIPRFFIARKFTSVLSAGMQMVDPRPKLVTLHVSHPTPTSLLPALNKVQDEARRRFDALKQQSDGEGRRALQLLRKESIFTRTLRAGSVAQILAQGDDANGRPFPVTQEGIKLDLPLYRRQGKESQTGSRASASMSADGAPFAQRIYSLAQSPAMLGDTWFQTLLTICNLAHVGQVFDPGNHNTGQYAHSHPRHVIVFCPAPIVTLVVFWFLKQHLSIPSEVRLLTSEFPEVNNREEHVTAWADEAAKFDALPVPGRKLVVGVVSTEVAGTGIDKLKFASIAVIFGEPMKCNARVQAAARLHRMGQEVTVMLYQFHRTDNPCLLSVEDKNNRRENFSLGRFQVAETQEQP